MNIYLIVKIDEEQIDGPSDDLYQMLTQGDRTATLHIDGMSFTVSVEQISHGRYPS